MPVTTKAQVDAESEDRVNSLNARMHEFLSKIKKCSKTRDIPDRSLTPTCGATILSKNEDEATRDGGLNFL